MHFWYTGISLKLQYVIGGKWCKSDVRSGEQPAKHQINVSKQSKLLVGIKHLSSVPFLSVATTLTIIIAKTLIPHQQRGDSWPLAGRVQPILIRDDDSSLPQIARIVTNVHEPSCSTEFVQFVTKRR